jgi:hypothetical protein
MISGGIRKMKLSKRLARLALKTAKAAKTASVVGLAAAVVATALPAEARSKKQQPVPDDGEGQYEPARDFNSIPFKLNLHYEKARRPLTATNLMYWVASHVWTKDGNFDAEHSVDLWNLTGMRKGMQQDRRPVQARIYGLPGVRDGTVKRYIRDHQDATHFYTVEYAFLANLLGVGRGYKLSNDEIRRLLIANQHKGEGTLDPNRISVLRYIATTGSGSNLDRKIDISAAESGPHLGDHVWDIVYRCPNKRNPNPRKRVCLGANGLPLGHISTGSQEIYDPSTGLYMVHPQINKLDHPLKMDNPKSGGYTLTTKGNVAIPMDIYGLPLEDRLRQRPDQDEADRTPPPAQKDNDNDDDGTQVPPPKKEKPEAPQLIEGPPGPKGEKGDRGESGPPGECYKNCNPVPPKPAPAPSPVPEPKPEPVTKGKRADWLFGARALYLKPNFGPELSAPMISLDIGRRVSDRVYLSLLLGYAYGSDRTQDPRSRTTLANPEDPFSLTSVVEAYNKRQMHMPAAEVEMKIRAINWLQFALGIGVHVPIIRDENHVLERLLYQNGEEADSNKYKTGSTKASVVGVGTAGIDLRLLENVSIGARGLYGIGADGKREKGVGGNLIIYW